MVLKVCKHGHPLVESNHDKNGACKTCRNVYRKAHRKQQAAAARKWGKLNPEKLRAQRRCQNQRRRQRGKIRYGHTKNVLVNVGEERMRQAFGIARETGSIQGVYELLKKHRWRAIRNYFPKVGKQMDKIITDTKAARRCKIILPARPAIIRAISMDLVGRISASVSVCLSRDHRDDVIGDIVEAVLSGRLKPGDIEKEATKFVRARFRTDHNKFGDLSLDVPLWTDGETRLIDVIPEEQGLWR
jgi:hypothetical protein